LPSLEISLRCQQRQNGFVPLIGNREVDIESCRIDWENYTRAVDGLEAARAWGKRNWEILPNGDD
jgi:hypothetical protein